MNIQRLLLTSTLVLSLSASAYCSQEQDGEFSAQTSEVAALLYTLRDPEVPVAGPKAGSRVRPREEEAELLAEVEGGRQVRPIAVRVIRPRDDEREPTEADGRPVRARIDREGRFAPLSKLLSEPRCTQARDLLRRAKAGDVNAMLDLGMYFRHGMGIKKDYQAAQILYEAAAETGDSVAQLRLGIMLKENLPGVQDFVKAYEWLDKASKVQVDARYHLADCLIRALGCQRDFARGMLMMKECADAGDQEAKWYYASQLLNPAEGAGDILGGIDYALRCQGWKNKQLLKLMSQHLSLDSQIWRQSCVRLPPQPAYDFAPLEGAIKHLKTLCSETDKGIIPFDHLEKFVTSYKNLNDWLNKTGILGTVFVPSPQLMSSLSRPNEYGIVVAQRFLTWSSDSKYRGVSLCLENLLYSRVNLALPEVRQHREEDIKKVTSEILRRLRNLVVGKSAALDQEQQRLVHNLDTLNITLSSLCSAYMTAGVSYESWINSARSVCDFSIAPPSGRNKFNAEYFQVREQALQKVRDEFSNVKKYLCAMRDDARWRNLKMVEGPLREYVYALMGAGLQIQAPVAHEAVAVVVEEPQQN
jgi:hypothetical protein